MPTTNLFKKINEFFRFNKSVRCNALILSRLIEFPMVFSLLSAKRDERICDIACGSGELSYRVAKRGADVHGIDIYISQIRKSEIFSSDNKLKCYFVAGMAEHLPYRTEVFDKAMSICSLEHFQDGSKAIKEIYRILKLEGILVLTVDSFSYPKIKKETIYKHKKRSSITKYYTFESLKSDLEIAGFEVIFGKYIINSSVSSFFFNKLLIEYKVMFPLLIVLSYTVFPICILYDKFFGSEKGGYEVIVKAKKCIKRHDENI